MSKSYPFFILKVVTICLLLIICHTTWKWLAIAGIILCIVEVNLFGFSGVHFLALGIGFKVLLLGAGSYQNQLNSILDKASAELPVK